MSFLHLMQHTHRDYYRCLWDSMSGDPSALGSAMYLGGSVFFILPMLPRACRVSPDALARCGQALYLGGGLLFMANQVEKHIEKVHQELERR